MFILYVFSSDSTLLNEGGNRIECDHLPRIGEALTIEQEWLPEEHQGDFIIFDIYHAVLDGQLLACVQVIAADEESRLQILRARSWMPDFEEGA